MPRITVTVQGDPAYSGRPIEFEIPEDQAGDLISFVMCLATKTDVLIPALMAIIACAAGGAPPPKP